MNTGSSGIPAFFVSLTLLALLIFSSVGPQARMVGGLDQINFLYGGKVISEGGLYYRDFVDPNFPGIIYFCSLVNRLASQTGSSPITVWVQATLLLSFLASLSFLMFSEGRLSKKTCHRLVIASFLVLALTPRNRFFGQREHWIACLLLPFLAAFLEDRIASISKTKLCVLGGCLAICIHLKPQFGLVALGISLIFLQNTSLKTVIALASSSFVAFFLLSFPILSIIDQDGFWVYSWQFGTVSYQSFSAGTLQLFVAGFFVLLDVFPLMAPWLLLSSFPAFSNNDVSLEEVLKPESWNAQFLVGLCFFTAFIQSKGWIYHFMPGQLLFSVLVVARLLQSFDSFEGPGHRLPKIGPILVLLLFSSLFWIRTISEGKNKLRDQKIAIETTLSDIPAGPIAVVSEKVPEPPFTPLMLERPQGSRFTWLGYIVPYYRMKGGLFKTIEPPKTFSEAQPEERAVLERMLKDWKASQPIALIFPESEHRWLPFDPLVYFQTVKELREFLGNFQEIKPIQGKHSCRRFIRKSPKN